MQKMTNGIQHYAWGSRTALTELYGIANPDNKPMAELWMGAHPLCSSKIDIDGVETSLRDAIASNPDFYLGTAVNQRFGELPFLFKVLCAAEPLSIQVHPSKSAAERGFARENVEGIVLTASQRNYKDPNHKPELVFALTPYLAMNGFREFDEIIRLLTPIVSAHSVLREFIGQPTEVNLSTLFATLLSLSGGEKQRALAVLKQVASSEKGEPWQTIRYLSERYPDDSGLFSPLLLNVIKLQPGEAMFLYAETPHAYLNGVGLEVMANSDNVLRAGLTPKYIDISELVANVSFRPQPACSLLMEPLVNGDEMDYPIPVDDFAFSIHQLGGKTVSLSQQSAAIVFCMNGSVTLVYKHEEVSLKPGESCFIPAAQSPVMVKGDGQIARVYNDFD